MGAASPQQSTLDESTLNSNLPVSLSRLLVRDTVKTPVVGVVIAWELSETSQKSGVENKEGHALGSRLRPL
jgi:hypothetical protein